MTPDSGDPAVRPGSPRPCRVAGRSPAARQREVERRARDTVSAGQNPGARRDDDSARAAGGGAGPRGPCRSSRQPPSLPSRRPVTGGPAERSREARPRPGFSRAEPRSAPGRRLRPRRRRWRRAAGTLPFVPAAPVPAESPAGHRWPGREKSRGAPATRFQPGRTPERAGTTTPPAPPAVAPDRGDPAVRPGSPRPCRVAGRSPVARQREVERRARDPVSAGQNPGARREDDSARAGGGGAGQRGPCRSSRQPPSLSSCRPVTGSPAERSREARPRPGFRRAEPRSAPGRRLGPGRRR